MSRIRGTDTKPELVVRRLLHKRGLRYRLHRRDLPGKPDIVFTGRRKVVFVHGCFWHRHAAPDCKLARLPKSRLDFWLPKLEGNRIRDEHKRNDLSRLGWQSMVVWECELSDLPNLEARLICFLNAGE